MMVRWQRFNINLCLVAAVLALAGCKSLDSEGKSARSTLRFFLETTYDPTGRKSDTVTVLKEPLVNLNIEKAAFLTEANVKEAKLIDIVGGFALSIQFDREGTWILENYTSASRGRRIAVYSQFVEPGKKEINKGRWIAALKISNRISDGLMIFAPDTTREEADQLAAGLQYVAKKAHSGVSGGE